MILISLQFSLQSLDLLLLVVLLKDLLLVLVALLLVLLYIDFVSLLQFLQAGLAVPVVLGISVPALADASVEFLHLLVLFLRLLG